MQKLSTKFNSLLFRNIIFILLFLFCSNKNFAQYILAGQHGATDYYVDVIPDSTVGVTGGSFVCALDINGDGTNDFNINVSGFGNSGAGDGYCSITPLNNNEVVFDYTDTCVTASISIHDISDAFIINDVIDNNQDWHGGNSLMLDYHLEFLFYGYHCGAGSFDNTRTYIGVRMPSASDTLYGWIKINPFAGPGYGVVIIEEYACNLSSTSISENSTEKLTEVYPNPFTTSSTLTINSISKIIQDAQLKIFNVLGREVQQYEIQNPKTEISRGKLSSGIYFYNVQNENEIIRTGKIIVQ